MRHHSIHGHSRVALSVKCDLDLTASLRIVRGRRASSAHALTDSDLRKLRLGGVDFRSTFHTGSWPKLSTHAIEKCFENPHFIFCSSFQNLRLGDHKLHKMMIACHPSCVSTSSSQDVDGMEHVFEALFKGVSTGFGLQGRTTFPNAFLVEALFKRARTRNMQRRRRRFLKGNLLSERFVRPSQIFVWGA
jgi:hypothetical protein